MSDKRISAGWMAAFLAAITVAAYLPVLRDGFVFDDKTLIVENPLVRAHDGLGRAWFTTQAPDYYPLTWSVWWLEWRLWGNHPLGYHAVNVGLHAASVVLMWIILRRLKIPGAWWAALLFAVHPVNVATVAWISEQKSTLSMLFSLAAALFYVQFDEDGRALWYGLSLAAFLLALLSKTAVVMLPVVLLGCVWWIHRRLRREDLQRSVPFFVASLIAGLTTMWFQHNRALAGQPAQPSNFLFRLVAAGWTPWFYLYKACLPFHLTVVYPMWHIDVSRWTSYVPGIALCSCLGLFWWKRETWGRPLLFGLGYFVTMLLPMSGLFYQGFNRFSLVADHWQYYSIVGVIALAVAGVEAASNRANERLRELMPAAGATVVVLLVLASWGRGMVYASNVTLWQDNVAKNPGPWPHNLLGCALEQTGRFDDAIREFQEALQIDPDYAEAHGNLGDTLLQTGKLDEAMAQWKRAVDLNPRYPQAHYNLGLGFAKQGRLTEAIEQWEEVLHIEPNYAEAHYNLGVAAERMGKPSEAIEHYRRALECKPDYTLARNRLARLRTGAVH